VIRAAEVERAVRVIHDHFSLSKDVVYREVHPDSVTGEMTALAPDPGSVT
jgi:hypothetical protein